MATLDLRDPESGWEGEAKERNETKRPEPVALPLALELELVIVEPDRGGDA